MIHAHVENGPASQRTVPPLPGTALNSTAQLAWFNLYQASQPQQQPLNPHDGTAASTLLPNHTQTELPFVGSDYEVVIPHAWPRNIAHIDHSIFSASKPYPVTVSSDYTDQKCECELCCISSTGTHLTSSCINVNSATVCDDSNCLLGPRCGNRFEQRFELDLIQTRVGLGVVSPNIIPQGAFVVEYVGEILYAEDAARRNDRRYQARFRTEAEWGEHSKVYVDALTCGNESRFINHSCKPNCVMYEFDWTNSTRLGIFATKEIPPLQELTFSYSRRNRQFFRCQCSAHVITT
ncbi:hypothetical protein PPTG_02365 [Phytophthora nicotianae INRA-310]|uniref:SET domain-containing protein n=2 Tax=Phytophthora nicotianae TaxID=4792 RepID=W2RB14_PHYN3|nr:hypothetical protein PPTG_02365 [Phytophthora nicotianae INRA-310]ETN22421.1 hypothetical protein PPTG_02365 [Phytophthora nicotianae INRA-310]KUF82127.1 hypothetical protein AM588_10000339 [Phytophthora nicotianae]